MRRLDLRIKKLATDSFHDNAKRDLMTPAECEEAALFYDEVATETVGREAELAARYNMERARFLRGEVDRIAFDANGFAQEIGWTKQGEDDVSIS